MKLIYCLLAIGMSITEGYGQTSKAIHPITVGDYLPNVKITNVYNYPTKSIQTRQLKSKIIILDFWATWCGSCIEAFPKMEHLQNTFKDTVSVIMVNSFKSDTKEKVDKLFKTINDRKGMKFTLPYVLSDHVMNKYFPNEYLPHYVFLDHTGKVLAITDADYVTEGNIRKLLAGENVMALKDDSHQFVPAKHTLLEAAMEDHIPALYISVFTPYLPDRGVGTFFDLDSTDLVTRFSLINTTLFGMYRLAYAEVFSVPFNRIYINESAKPALFDKDNKMISYSYELFTKPISKAKSLTYLKRELKNNFNLKAVRQDSLFNCWVLTSIGNNAAISAHDEKPANDVDPESLHKFLRNESVDQMVYMLGVIFPGPWVDESKLENITVEFPKNFYDLSLAEMNFFLAEYNLKIIKAPRTISIAILTNSK